MARFVVVPGSTRHAVLTGLAGMLDLRGLTVHQEIRAAKKQLLTDGAHPQHERTQQWLRVVTWSMVIAMGVVVIAATGATVAVITTGHDWWAVPAVPILTAPTVAAVLLARSSRQPAGCQQPVSGG